MDYIRFETTSPIVVENTSVDEKTREDEKKAQSKKNDIYKSTVKGIMLIILSVAANFIAQTLGCKTRKLLLENIIVKHFVVLFIIYFAINFTSSNEVVHPIDNIVLSIKIWIGYIIFTKMNIFFTAIVFSLFTILYIYGDFIKYYEAQKNNEIYQPYITFYYNHLNKFIYALFGITSIGFVYYFIKRYNEYYKTWSFTQFLFGRVKCNSIREN